MKKLFFFIVTTSLITFTARAKVSKQEILKNKIEKPTKPSLPPPPSPPTYTPIYTLTAAKISLQTGIDNKEFQSWLRLTLIQKLTMKEFSILRGNGIRNQLPVNSVVDFGMQLVGEKIKLEALQQTGIRLKIHYEPNFFLDAWKIKGLKLTLEFKDQNHNLHPVHGHKTIVLNTATGILKDNYLNMDCIADRTFTPLTSPISQD